MCICSVKMLEIMFPGSYIFFVSFFHLSMYMLSFFSVVWIHFPFVAFFKRDWKRERAKNRFVCGKPNPWPLCKQWYLGV